MNPGDEANKANRWGVLKIEKQQMQIVDPSKPCEYHANIVKVQEMNITNETVDLGCMEEKAFVLLDLGPGFLLSKALRGGCWISFSFFVSVWLHCFYLRQLFHFKIYSNSSLKT